jgi:hypothetical protein
MIFKRANKTTDYQVTFRDLTSDYREISYKSFSDLEKNRIS